MTRARDYLALAWIVALIPVAIVFSRLPAVLAWIDEAAAAVDEWRMR